jgi:hypothetical protein
MGSHRKKKASGSSSGNNTSNRYSTQPPEEAAASSTSSASTDAAHSYTMVNISHRRGTNGAASNMKQHMQPVESGGSEASHSTVHETTTKMDRSNNNRNNNKNSGTTTIAAADWSNDFAKAMQEIEGTNSNSQSSLRFSWKEMFALCLVLIAFASISIFVGIAAGISISVHYYETPESVDHLRLLNYHASSSGSGASAIMDNGVSPHRVTILDPAIANSNRLHPFMSSNGGVAGDGVIVGDALRRVLHASSATGIKTLLPIVEESPMDVNMPGSTTATAATDTATADRTGFEASSSSSSTLPPPPRPRYPVMILEEWLRETPKLCSDRKTVGYDSWMSLRLAIRDINLYSATRYDRWNSYFATVEEMVAAPELYPEATMLNPSSFADDRMYYEERIVVTICPGAILKPVRRYPLFINTESVTLECGDGSGNSGANTAADNCQVVGGTTHLSFGPAAQNIVVRGISFRLAGSSSLLFHHDGAEVAFEDCTWIVRDKKKSSLGAIAEVNSTSSISFSRCVASEPDGRLSEMTTSLRNAKDVLRYANVRHGSP